MSESCKIFLRKPIDGKTNSSSVKCLRKPLHIVLNAMLGPLCMVSRARCLSDPYVTSVDMVNGLKTQQFLKIAFLEISAASKRPLL